jgi:hypothetical protein
MTQPLNLFVKRREEKKSSCPGPSPPSNMKELPGIGDI